MRAIFINRYFYPDHSATSEILADLAFALRERGVSVTVITSRLNYEDGESSLPSRETIRGVEVHRVWTTKRGRRRLTGRTLDYLSMYLAAGWRLWRLAHRGDVVVAKTDPPLLSVVIAPIVRLKGAHLVNWLQDLFPEVAEALNVGGGPARLAYRLMRPLRNMSLRAAKANVVVGQSMAAHLQAQGIAHEKICLVPNWSDGAVVVPIEAEKNQLRKSLVPDSGFIVAYAGNLGRAHDVDTIIEAMALLHARAKGSPAEEIAAQVTFVFIGGGVQRARLETEVIRRKLTNARMQPYQKRECLAETLGLADCHLVSLNPKLEGLIVPSKFYSVAAAGRPTLFIGARNGEIARLIDEAGCGFTVAPGDGKGLMDRILQLANDPKLCANMGARGRAALEQRWNKELSLDQWVAVLSATFRSTVGTR